MRTNYKRIQRVLVDSGAEVERSRTNGLVAIYDQGLNSEQRVRVVLVDGNSYQSEIGCHMTRIDSESFDTHLANTIETALKDMFPTIWVHQKPKPSTERRESLILSVNKWIDSFQNVESKHILNKLDFDLKECLETMTEDQIDAVQKLISAAFNKGHHDSRTFWSKSYHEIKDQLKALEST